MRTFIGKTRTLAITVVALLAVIFGGAIVSFVLVVGQTNDALYNGAEELIHAEQLAETFERKLASLRGYLLIGDAESRRDFEETGRELDDRMGRMAAGERDPEGRRRLQAVAGAVALHDERLDALRSQGLDRLALADAWGAEVYPASTAARRTLAELVDHKRRKHEQSKASVAAMQRRTTWILGAIIAGALALLIAGGAFLARAAAQRYRAERRGREEAEHAHRFLGELLDQLPVGVIATEAPSGRIIHVNQSALKILGASWSADELPLARARGGEVVEREQARLAGGRFVESTAGPIRDEEGKIVAAVVTFHDVTDRRLAELEREVFLDALGHDLRNPLGAILLGAQSVARRKDLPDRPLETVSRIASSAERMSRLITQLLDFARSRASAIPIDPTPCDLHDLTREVISGIQLGCTPTCDVRLEYEGDGHGHWDRDRLGQVLQNLIGNALEHAAPGTQVKVRIRPEETPGGHLSVLEVSNHGQPIPPELLPTLFAPFRRGKKGKGLGLGLYIARAIVDAHGGSISATSEDGVTTFRVELPVDARQTRRTNPPMGTNDAAQGWGETPSAGASSPGATA